MNPLEGRIWDLERRLVRLEWMLLRTEVGATYVQQKLREVEHEYLRQSEETEPGPPDPPDDDLTITFTYINQSGVQAVDSQNLNFEGAGVWRFNLFGLTGFGVNIQGFIFSPNHFPFGNSDVQLTYSGGVMTAQWITRAGNVSLTLGQHTLTTVWPVLVDPTPPFHGVLDLAGGPTTVTLIRQNPSGTLVLDPSVREYFHMTEGGGGAEEFVPWPDMTPPWNLVSVTIDPTP